ncbi:MAG: hypothetical protein PVG14_16480 [Anaerolineales bacterium]|jgi:hypothetical protein
MAKFLRFVAIVLMGLTAAFTLLSGVGTTCVALAAENYDSMTALAPYKWLYVLFVLFTTAIGVLGVRVTVRLVKGRENAPRAALTALVLGILVGVIHMAVSRSLRGSSMPVDPVVYTTGLTLIIFSLLRLPGAREKVGFERVKGDDENVGPTAAAITLLLSGALTLSVGLWAAPTHTMNGGVNYADAFHVPMTIAGWGLILFGIGLLVWTRSPKALGQGDLTGDRCSCRSG